VISRLDILSPIAHLNSAADAEFVLKILALAFAPFGSTAVLVNIDLPRGPPGIFAQTGLPDELSAVFARTRYLQFSPVGRLARSSFVPVHWTKETWIDDPDPRAREVMRAVESFGFREGCVIPVRGPRGLEADVSLAGDKVAIGEDYGPLVHCLAYYGFVRLRRLLAAPRRPRPLLTLRDRDVLVLSARGNSTAEIAVTMGIAERTVEEHVRHACRRLGARNRTHAVAIAIRDGHIGT
jgi:LuxR family quorum sensing-dependent transcriptional regulator